MSANAIATAKKVENNKEEGTMSSGNLVVTNKVDIQKVEETIRLEHVSSESLLRNGFEAIPSKGCKNVEQPGTVYYVKPTLDICFVYIRSDEGFFVLDKDVVERRGYCALYVEHDYLRVDEPYMNGKPRNIHRLLFIMKGNDLTGKEIDHIFLNKRINTLDALRPVSHEVNVANTVTSLINRVKYYDGNSVIRLNFIISDDNQEVKEIMEQYGFKPSRDANKKKKRTWVSKNYDANSLEAYIVLVKILYELYGDDMYSPFWDLSCEEGLDLYFNFKVLETITEEDVAVYNFDYIARKVEESKAILESLKLWDYQKDALREYEKYIKIFNYMLALYEVFGDAICKRPKSAVI